MKGVIILSLVVAVDVAVIYSESLYKVPAINNLFPPGTKYALLKYDSIHECSTIVHDFKSELQPPKSAISDRPATVSNLTQKGHQLGAIHQALIKLHWQTGYKVIILITDMDYHYGEKLTSNVPNGKISWNRDCHNLFPKRFLINQRLRAMGVKLWVVLPELTSSETKITSWAKIGQVVLADESKFLEKLAYIVTHSLPLE